MNSSKTGSALILVLWTVIIMSLLIGTFAFEMHIEAKIATLERQRFKAQEIARAGFEYANALLSAPQLTTDKIADETDSFQSASDRLRNGMNISGLTYDLPDGAFTLSIESESGRRNINKLSEDEWTLLLDECGIPTTEQDKLIDCYIDWIDEGDLHQLNGAESDDSFYVELGYNCKNAPIETIDELRLIKNFTPLIIDGGTTEDGEVVSGIADKLTVWGDGKVNINSTSEEVLMSFLELDEAAIDEILDLRNGLDGEEGTKDDGFKSLDEIGLDKQNFSTESPYLRITSRAQTENFIYEIQSVVYLNNDKVTVVFWSESFLAPESN